MSEYIKENLHTIFTYVMALVGLVLIAGYFMVKSQADGYIKTDTTDDKYQKRFDDSMAGVLAMGTAFLTLSVVAIYAEKKGVKLGESAGVSLTGYMIMMALVGVVSIVLLSVALSSVDTSATDAAGEKTKAGVTVGVLLALSVVATGVGGFYSSLPLFDKKGSGGDFGFDFEF